MYVSRLAPVLGAILFCAFPAFSAPVAPGAVIFPTGTSFVADSELGGLVVNDDLLNFRMDPTPATPLTDVGGRVQNRVVRSNELGSLIFNPRIRDTFNIDGGTFGIVAFRLDGYAGWDLDVDFRTDGLGDKGITSVSRSVTGDLLTLRFNDPLFIDAIAPGVQQESLFTSIKTGARRFKNTGTMTIFGNLFSNATGSPVASGDLVSVTIDGLAVPAVPLPAGGVLIVTAMLGLFGVRRLQTRASS